MNDSAEKDNSCLNLFVVFGIIVTIFASICIILCCVSVFKIETCCWKYSWLPPILRFACFALTAVTVLILCKLFLDFGVKINHDTLSFEKAKMISAPTGSSIQNNYTKTINKTKNITKCRD